MYTSFTSIYLPLSLATPSRSEVFIGDSYTLCRGIPFVHSPPDSYPTPLHKVCPLICPDCLPAWTSSTYHRIRVSIHSRSSERTQTRTRYAPQLSGEKVTGRRVGGGRSGTRRRMRFSQGAPRGRKRVTNVKVVRLARNRNLHLFNFATCNPFLVNEMRTRVDLLDKGRYIYTRTPLFVHD